MKPIDDLLDDDFDKLSSAASAAEHNPPEWFDEEAYLLANPDVASSVESGDFESAWRHYLLHGKSERRALHGKSGSVRNRMVRTRRAGGSEETGEVRGSVEAVLISPRGGLLVIGWVDDLAAPMDSLTFSQPGWYIALDASRSARFRRRDVEDALGMPGMHAFGFFAFIYLDQTLETQARGSVKLTLADGRNQSFEMPIRRVVETELRNTVLTYVAESELFGNRQVEAVELLGGPIGKTIIKHNRDISADIVAGAFMERFCRKPGKLKGSLVICLYGKPEYMFLQNALFNGGTGFEDYELVYVCNSPELGEQLMKDMRTASLVYDLAQTLVLLPGNAGFGAANNIAVTHARSDRILIVNPDVFPKDEDWAAKHTAVVENRPRNETRLFGAPLYYDDGTLMHGGMYFEFDTGITGNQYAMTGRRMVRVEHYGKGAPPWQESFNQPRPVPAVTGAFISAERSWYEKLGGFTEDFVFGHYEDADLCLKSTAEGNPPWIHDIRLWHLEGKGSKRLPVHEGGSYVNRALFSERWDGFIEDGLVGPTPTHPLLQAPSAHAPATTPTVPTTAPKAAVKIAKGGRS